ncbi:hypothetical protein V1291_004150 [Nitrobacteraceae bacterium AZCC 1564]
MRANSLAGVLLPVVLFAAPALADPPKAAVFDFELVDTSLQGEISGGPRADEQARLKNASDQLRKGLADSGKFLLVDIAPVSAAAHNSNLQACGGCDVRLAQKVGADLSVTGVVQKVSNLILNMNVYIRDVHTGQMVAAASADLRGNTDESWSRAVVYLLRNRLLAPKPGTVQ